MRIELHAKASVVAFAFIAAVLVPGMSAAQSMPPKGRIFGPTSFSGQGGAAIYKAICQGCHMPGAIGSGASGVGSYPALAHNAKLATAGYPVLRVLYGQGAMPAFKDELDDQQIADVVTYVRANFGNAYADKVGAADVKALRK